MKKVLCIESAVSKSGLHKVEKDKIYTVIKELALTSGIPGYILEGVNSTGVDQSLFIDIQPAKLATFTKLIEEYIVHAN